MKQYTLVLLIIGVSMLMLFTLCKTTDKIYVDKKTSYFSDFEVENDKVFIKCYITLTNTFDVEKTVNLSTKLPEDVTIGLLKTEEIKALNEDGSKMDFVLPPNASKSFDVVFIGEYADTDKQHDRNLSEINIEIVKQLFWIQSEYKKPIKLSISGHRAY